MRKGTIRFRGGRVLREGQLKEEDLWVEAGKISGPLPVDQEVDATGLIIAPGYIDCQINGGYGVDFATGVEAIQIVARALPHHGVTSFLPTFISSKNYKLHLPTVEGATPLGIHLEGPFLNPQYAGAHSHLQSVWDPDFYGDLSFVKMVTLAPELFPRAIVFLKQKGIVVSAGHTDATYSQMAATSVDCFTHLFNATRPFHHREPGVIGFALTEKIPFSLIADGFHLHPAAVKMAWEANPDSLFLVSDAMAGFGMGDGSFPIGERTVVVKDGMPDTLAGSICGLDQAVRNLYAWTGCRLEEALEAASSKPAKLLGIYGKKGCLDIGADADLILLDKRLNVQETYIAGVKSEL